jgi:hypothetical protein
VVRSGSAVDRCVYLQVADVSSKWPQLAVGVVYNAVDSTTSKEIFRLVES